MTDKLIVIHYDEIALKGGRRRYFERKLVRNIRQSCPSFADAPLRRLYDRILLGPLNTADFAEAVGRLQLIPGISWFSEVQRLPVEPDSLDTIADTVSQRQGRYKFRVTTRRSQKNFPLTSVDVNRRVGARIQERTGWAVDLENPDLTVFIDVTPQGVLAYDRKQRGLGGLPVGSNGKLVALLSGGIDSPVAAFKMMCRGCEIVFLHFHNFSPDSLNVRRKVVRLVEQLAKVQPVAKLYMVPFGKVQSEIVAAVPPRMRMVAYRRAMLRLGASVLKSEGAQGFVVGDSVGQVASQTLDNIRATYAATDSPILAPLIGEHKQAIMKEARRIGTYETSILPYDDCCQLLLAKSPETRCTVSEVEELEQSLDWDHSAGEMKNETEVIEITPAPADVLPAHD